MRVIEKNEKKVRNVYSLMRFCFERVLHATLANTEEMRILNVVKKQ